MYKLVIDWRGDPSCIIRLNDGAAIPFDLANTDYQQYLKFLEEGGQPLPADNPEQVNANN